MIRTLTAILLLTMWAPAQEPDVSLESVLACVQTNTGQFEQNLPDFVCDETVLSKIVQGGIPIQTSITSHFVGQQKKNGRMSYTESRELVTVDGQPAEKDQKFEGPFILGGGFSSVLDQTFAPRFTASHIYRFAGDEVVAGRPALVLEFATKEGQSKLLFQRYGKTVVQKDDGKAWIDKETWQVLRLERRYLNVEKGQTPLVATVEYGEVRIDGKPFWMPKSVHAKQYGLQGSGAGEYLATYTNYRKFAVSSGIVFDVK